MDPSATDQARSQVATYMEIMNKMLEIVSKMYDFASQFMQMNIGSNELSNVLQEVVSSVADMDEQVKLEAAKPGKKRKNVVDAYISRANVYTESAQSVLDRSLQEQWILKRMRWVPSIERHCKEGQELLTRGNQLRKGGLTHDEIILRGEMLPLENDQYMGKTFCRLIDSAFQEMKDDKAKCIGIYGYTGAGKTNLMKHLYNKVYEHKELFRAVFWGTAPELQSDQGSYNKALQNCVADAMWIDLDNDVVHDEVRCAGRIMARLHEIGQGRAVLFLDNVKEEFSAFELLGIPSLMTAESTDNVASANCILVFSTLSKDICNKMRCDLSLKMELLEKEEAEELFLHELKRGDDNPVLSNQEQRIKNVAIQVANECAKMPLAIIVIARSMISVDDIREWKHRLNEMMGVIGGIHDEEDKIVEQLKFGYSCLKGNSTVQLCFLAAEKMLSHDRQISKAEIIQNWKENRLIGMDREDEFADDQGHTILNQLERMCFLQVAPDDQITVTMNKWIWRMAKKVESETQVS